MFGLFRNRARENATKCIRLMVLFRQVQRGIDRDTLEAIGRKHAITIIRSEDCDSTSRIPTFPELLLVSELEHPTSKISLLTFVGVGPMKGFFLMMRAASETISVTAETHVLAGLAYRTARELRGAGDNIKPSLIEGGFSANYELDELAANAGEPEAI